MKQHASADLLHVLGPRVHQLLQLLVVGVGGCPRAALHPSPHAAAKEAVLLVLNDNRDVSDAPLVSLFKVMRPPALQRLIVAAHAAIEQGAPLSSRLHLARAGLRTPRAA